jgi:uncharacterized protein DUF6152
MTQQSSKQDSRKEKAAMGRFNLVVSVALLVGLVLCGTVSAHHSVQAQFDVRKQVTVSGTVAKLEFINPHSYLTINMKDAEGKMTKFAFELGGVAAIRRAGLSRADRGGLKVGDEVTAVALPSRNGANSGFLLELTVSDGRVFKFTTDNNGN